MNAISSINSSVDRLKYPLSSILPIINSDIIFLAVGTPMKNNGESDLSYINNAAKSIGKYINSYKQTRNKIIGSK